MASNNCAVYEEGDIVLFTSNVCQIVSVVHTPFGWKRYELQDLKTGENYSVPKHCIESVDVQDLPTLVLDMDWDEDILMPGETELISQPVLDLPLMTTKSEEVTEVPVNQTFTEVEGSHTAAAGKSEASGGRHVNMESEEIDAVANEHLSSNTEHQTRWAVALFRDFLNSRNLDVKFEDQNDEVLAENLRVFYACVRKMPAKGETVGQEYSRSAYRNMRAGLQRFLVSPPNNRLLNLMTDKVFQSANQVYNGQIKKLKKMGMDITKHKPPIAPEDMQRMYESGTLSNNNPVALQRKVFMEVSLHFGRRGREGWRLLRKSSFAVEHDANNLEFVTIKFNELDKNHQDSEVKHQVMYASPDSEHCPVKSFKLYCSKLNPKCEAFLHRPDPKYESKPYWYVNSPLGINTIASIMKSVSAEANCSKMYTNHSIKASTATILKQAGYPAQDIMCITGHRNVASLNSYAQGPSCVDRANMSKSLLTYGKCLNQTATSSRKDSKCLVIPSASLPSSALPAAPVEQAATPCLAESTVSASAVAIDPPIVTLPDEPASLPVIDIQTRPTSTTTNVVANRHDVTYDNIMSSIFARATFSGNVTLNVQIHK